MPAPKGNKYAKGNSGGKKGKSGTKKIYELVEIREAVKKLTPKAVKTLKEALSNDAVDWSIKVKVALAIINKFVADQHETKHSGDEDNPVKVLVIERSNGEEDNKTKR